MYPVAPLLDSGRLSVSDIHTLYWERRGNPDGIPVVFLHGGPGFIAKAEYTQLFPPDKFHTFLFDQRGAGRSTPYAELKDNTTPNLAEDINRLRLHFGLNKWAVTGVSWGSALALAYAQTYPEQVTHLLLRGVSLAERSGADWFVQAGTHHLFPDWWEDYEAFIPSAERHDMMAAYSHRLNCGDSSVELEAAKQFNVWDTAISALRLPLDDIAEIRKDPATLLSVARLFCHYAANDFFLADRPIIANMDKIAHLPGHIVHGRYDMICPMSAAWKLHKAWPASQLHIIPDAGHSQWEPGIISKMTEILHIL
ncbi:MAG: prolyl aminopeptidase [Proteobacteria bacterium]|nr:prolyl aminopeptidase [Pseudomonadota bacterium]